MNQDKKLCLLLVPMIFMVFLFVPVMIGDIAYECMNINILASPKVIRYPYVIMLVIAMLTWCVTFYHIPIGVYIAMLAIYTGVAWTWILRRKKGTVMYFIVWFVLGVLSILMYWKFEPQYYSMINM